MRIIALAVLAVALVLAEAVGAAELVPGWTLEGVWSSNVFRSRDEDQFGNKIPKEDAVARNVAIQQGLIEAMQAPLKTLEACLGVARCAARAATKGNTNAASDAGVAALLAGAAARGAAYNVRINLGSLIVKEQGQPMVQQAQAMLAEVEKYVKIATDGVEAHLVG